MAAPSGAAFLGESGQLEERNPWVKTTPQLLSPRVPGICSAFDRPLSDIAMIDSVEIPRPEITAVSRNLARNQALGSVYRSLSGVCRIKSGLRPRRSLAHGDFRHTCIGLCHI